MRIAVLLRRGRKNQIELMKTRVSAKASIENFKERHRPIFAIGTGRSGTHFLHKLMEEDKTIASYHIETPDADSFVEYCMWNNLLVDLGGFIETRQRRIDRAALAGRIYFESNPYLSLCVIPLFENFQSRFVYIIRKPEDVVNSHYVKGWYRDTYVRSDVNLALGFQPGLTSNHFFGRLVPHGEEFTRWQGLTRIGKISWMWNAVHMEIRRQLALLPSTQHILVELEELDYSRYCEIHSFVGGSEPMPEARFERIKRQRPGKGRKRQRVSDWSDQERYEFLVETESARTKLGF